MSVGLRLLISIRLDWRLGPIAVFVKKRKIRTRIERAAKGVDTYRLKADNIIRNAICQLVLLLLFFGLEIA